MREAARRFLRDFRNGDLGHVTLDKLGKSSTLLLQQHQQQQRSTFVNTANTGYSDDPKQFEWLKNSSEFKQLIAKRSEDGIIRLQYCSKTNSLKFF